VGTVVPVPRAATYLLGFLLHPEAARHTRRLGSTTVGR